MKCFHVKLYHHRMKHGIPNRKTFLLTDEQLAVELQAEVSISRSCLGCNGQIVQSKRRFFDVPLSSNAMPPVVVQRDA